MMSKARKTSADDLPMLPRASLLIGMPPSFLMVTNERESLRLQPEYDQPESRSGKAIYPSVSNDGKVVAYARLKAGKPERVVAISTYSAETDKHTDYAEGEYSGSIAISPDASKLAFSASRQREDGPGDNHLHIIDLKTGQQTLGPEISQSWPAYISWSPDSHSLTYSSSGEIRVWNSDTGKVLKIADGDLPVWSPSGEWIAYLQGTWDNMLGRVVFTAWAWAPRCFVVHPNGTGEKLLIDLPHKKNFPRILSGPPVWSPDSSTILLNEAANVDTATVNVHSLDLKTHELKTVFKDSVRVLGWAKAK